MVAKWHCCLQKSPVNITKAVCISTIRQSNWLQSLTVLRYTPCGVAFPMEWMCVATYLLNAESINACRCGVANKSRMIWRWLVLIGWATVWRQQQGSDQASRYSSASLLAGRRWRAVRGRALVNNSASGVCILLCVVATCVVSRVSV